MYEIMYKKEVFDLNCFGKGLAMHKPDHAFKFLAGLLYSQVFEEWLIVLEAN